MSNKRIIYGLLFTLVIGCSVFIFLKIDTKKNTSPILEITYPEDNLRSDAKIEFGRQLFFDKRLSFTEKIACSSCHLPQLAFTDGKKKSVGINGNHSMRNASTLFNVGFAPTFMADAHITSLEMQAIVPIQDTNEMGMRMGELIGKLRGIQNYNEQSLQIFGRDFDAFVLTRSLAAFQRSLISLDSPFDSYYQNGDESEISAESIKGWKLFSEKFNCIVCHPPPFFTTFEAENNGLTVDFQEDFGRFRVTKDSSDYGKFKIPTLRNISLTSPYLHDGSVENLEQIIDLYSQGGYFTVNQSDRIIPLDISREEKKALISFLRSLTGSKK